MMTTLPYLFVSTTICTCRPGISFSNPAIHWSAVRTFNSFNTRSFSARAMTVEALRRGRPS